MITNERFETADKDYECNACLHLQCGLEELLDEVTEEERIIIELARANNWKVRKGEQCRRYTCSEGTDEECECIEIPAIAEICTKYGMWLG